MDKKKNEKNKIKFSKLFHVHLTLTGTIFAMYIIFSLVWSPEFLLADIRNKFQALADEIVNISAHVVGPPQKPIVSANAVCNNGNLYVNLDWADDDGSESFDVERDGSILVAGINSSEYKDSNLTVGNIHSYVVTARGSMGPGFAVSDPVTVTTPAECKVVLPPPSVTITGINKGSVNGVMQMIATTSQTPVIYGTTNVANALVDIVISGNVNFVSQEIASSNGYWQWQPPTNLPYGDYNIFVTVNDPNDSDRTVTAQYALRVSKEKEEEKNSGNKKGEKPKSVSSELINDPQQESENKQNVNQEEPEIPLTYSLFLGSVEVLQGRNLSASIVIENVAEKFLGREAIVRYSIFDSKGKLISEDFTSTVLEKGKRVDKYLPISKSMLAGGYNLNSEIIFSDYDVSRNASFMVLALPAVKLGGGFVINYQDLLSEIGTVSLWFLVVLFIWLGILSREYWLSMNALDHITEKSLTNLGMVPMRKKKR